MHQCSLKTFDNHIHSLLPLLPCQEEAFLSQTWRMKEAFLAVIQHFIGSQKVNLLKSIQLLGSWKNRNTYSTGTARVRQVHCYPRCNYLLLRVSLPGSLIIANCMNPSYGHPKCGQGNSIHCPTMDTLQSTSKYCSGVGTYQSTHSLVHLILKYSLKEGIIY